MVLRPSAYGVTFRLQCVPRTLQGRVRVPRALHGHEGRPTRLAPAPRALGARAMSDDEQTQLETGVARVPAGTGDAGAGGEPDALGVRAPPSPILHR